MMHIRPLITLLLAAALCGCTARNESTAAAGSPPEIFPDYAGVTIPPNIAPLNFRIGNGARRAEVLFTAGDRQITVGSRDGRVIIPQRKWRRLTAAARDSGGTITVTVTTRGSGGTRLAYDPFTITVAADPVDPYIVYRLIEPGYETWGRMGIYQRCLENFRQTPVIENSAAGYGCINCHSFCNRSPERMLFHMREKHSGTIVTDGMRVERLDTSTPETQSPLVYPSWHPSGRYVAFSVNTTRLLTLPADPNRVEVFDSASDVVVYDTERREIVTAPHLFAGDRFETFPTFSPDGRTLYFCSADSVSMPDDYRLARYSLCAVEFDPDTRRIGTQTDTLYNARTEGRSAAFPRVSPDGRFMLYSLSDYGTFTIWHRDADLQMIDLATGRQLPVDAMNSDEAESYHSWSGNSRWIVFNSRRTDGLYTRAFIAHIDEHGRASKPFMLPQRDPDFYSRCMQSYNIPEFTTGRIRLRPRRLVSHARGDEAGKVRFVMQE